VQPHRLHGRTAAGHEFSTLRLLAVDTRNTGPIGGRARRGRRATFPGRPLRCPIRCRRDLRETSRSSLRHRPGPANHAPRGSTARSRTINFPAGRTRANNGVLSVQGSPAGSTTIVSGFPPHLRFHHRRERLLPLAAGVSRGAAPTRGTPRRLRSGSSFTNAASAIQIARWQDSRRRRASATREEKFCALTKVRHAIVALLLEARSSPTGALRRREGCRVDFPSRPRKRGCADMPVD